MNRKCIFILTAVTLLSTSCKKNDVPVYHDPYAWVNLCCGKYDVHITYNKSGAFGTFDTAYDCTIDIVNRNKLQIGSTGYEYPTIDIKNAGDPISSTYMIDTLGNVYGTYGTYSTGNINTTTVNINYRQDLRENNLSGTIKGDVTGNRHY